MRQICATLQFFVFSKTNEHSLDLQLLYGKIAVRTSSLEATKTKAAPRC